MTLWTILFAILGFGIAIARPKWSIFILLLFYTVRPFLLVIIPDIKIFGDAIILGCLLHVIYINKSTLKKLF